MKLVRNDLVKVALAKLKTLADAELVEARMAELKQRQRFADAMRNEAMFANEHVVRAACQACGTTSDRLTVDVLLEMRDDVLASPPNAVNVVLRDAELYEARLVLRLLVPARRDVLRDWVESVKRVRVATIRVNKATNLGDEARAAAIVELLGSSEEGKKCIELLAVVSAQLEQAEGAAVDSGATG